jgi:DNA-binding response OmpR family regulator
VLVVDDDEEMLKFLRLRLGKEGFRVLEAADGRRGLELALKENPDIVLLDVVMPVMSGVKVCAELRRRDFDKPILMLTSQQELDQRIAGLNSGADDYLAKPFEFGELVARIQSLLRRQQRDKHQGLVLELDGLRVDLVKRSAMRGTTPLKLTGTEFALLELLARHAGQPVSRERFLDSVWGYTYLPTTRTVDTHIYRLRKKLGDDADQPKWILNVPGEGYSLSASAIVRSL